MYVWQVRGAVKAAAAEHGVSATIFTFFYVYSEMDKLMQPEMVRELAPRRGHWTLAAHSSASMGPPSHSLCLASQIQNMALALCGIAFASLVFLGSLHVTALIVLMIALIDVALLGCVLKPGGCWSVWVAAFASASLYWAHTRLP